VIRTSVAVTWIALCVASFVHEVVQSHDPFPLRWLIGIELARHREAAGLSMTEVAERVGITKPKLAHVETGRQVQSPTDIALLLTAYGVDRETIDGLVALTERADEASWWTGSARAVPDWFRIYLGLERVAAQEFVYQPTVIPGLLQTEAYARAVHAASLLTSAADVERMVEVRLARASRLFDDRSSLHIHAVIAEAAPRLRVANGTTTADQLRHLVTMAERPNVTLQVVRPEYGYHDQIFGSLVLLDFAEVRSIGYVEVVQGAMYVQDPDEVHACTLVTDQLKRVALDHASSVDLIASLVDTVTD
jgi:transcriptional regulator with XRE-family HTH domain